ncbi:extracellular trypsin protease [Periconia macrospinosa]|uniref:Extracellular trypsin protease n=1 Tax=Periconia macrospinosa TaxID=97972 RepID=A0A2V1DRT5_9PLEO|nr:extracellular trypsin protease [Periconia macrospinosa]
MLSKLVLVLALSTLVVAAPTPQEQSVQIVGGTAAKAGQFPYIVSLQWSGAHLCGGSLLNADTVLTAAHCTAFPVSLVRAGSLRSQSGGIVSGVLGVISNPDYLPYDNDIAIIKLSNPIPEGNGISYASLPEAGSDPVNNTMHTTAGWGLTVEDGWTGPQTLQYVDVPIVDRATCKKQYEDYDEISENMVCAGFPQGGKDACNGDSGGPLITTGTKTVIGIVSWGLGCARPNYAGVYSRVSSQLDFIKANL